MSCKIEAGYRSSIVRIIESSRHQLLVKKKIEAKEPRREQKYEDENLPSLEPTERLPLEALAPLTFLLFLRTQKTRASSARTTSDKEPRTMPTISPADGPLSESDCCPSEAGDARVPDPGLRLL